MPVRILIVEDDQIIAADLRLKLQALGHEVIGIALSGEEAITMAGQFKPEIVLMDIQLETAMSGAEAARIIRERTGASIIFITAFSGAAFRGETVGMLDEGSCVGKPFSQSQLAQAVDTQIRKRSQRYAL